MKGVRSQCCSCHIVQRHRIRGIDLDDCIGSDLVYSRSHIIRQQHRVKLKDVVGRVEPVDVSVPTAIGFGLSPNATVSLPLPRLITSFAPAEVVSLPLPSLIELLAPAATTALHRNQFN
jgi:hypothetical protein